ncbi:MAG: ABC transporter permease [Candidatus Krumholzibacteriota bacterium]|nr:ABC transporter permease [Candidatus Krumholzibacteriota bacterium]
MKIFRFILAESLGVAVRALMANKSRAILTTLGVVIGILAVATTMTVSNGLGNNFRESIAAVGSDVLYVSRMPWIITGDFFRYRNRPRITYKESELLARRLTGSKAVNPSTGTARNVKFRSNVLEDVTIIGTTDKQMLVASGVPEFGRFFSATDVHNKKSVCVIGREIREHLFGEADPLHKDIKIGRHSFSVIGVMEKQGSGGFFGGPNFDRQIFVPITSFAKAYGNRNRGFTIAVKASSQEGIEEFRYELTGEMRKVRKLGPTDEDDFSINSMDSLMNAYNNVMGVVILIGFIITSFSLFVGGIGVMNIMLVSVTERTREIGIRKALGARRKIILTEFLFESCFICLIGGGIGLLLSYVVAALIDSLVMPASVSLPVIMAAIAISFIVGIVSGIMPAMRASKLNPIDALQYE